MQWKKSLQCQKIKRGELILGVPCHSKFLKVALFHHESAPTQSNLFLMNKVFLNKQI